MGFRVFRACLILQWIASLTEYASVVNRLAVFDEACENAASDQSRGDRQIELVEDGAQVSLEDVTLMTPDWSRTLQQDVSFSVGQSDRLLLSGPTGAGKTSLMRAVAGLWSFGSGRIRRPSREEIMFMPQKPYLILGSLRQQMQYPHAGEVSSETLMEVLREVDLAYLPEQFAGLDAEVHWADVLSGGEQQRLAFARLLLNRPRFAILDEATSALDVASEERLYSRLACLPT